LVQRTIRLLPFIIKLNDEYENDIQFVGVDIPSGGIESSVERLVSITSAYNESDSAIDALQADPRITEKNMNHVRAMINTSSTKLYQPNDLFEYQYHLQNIVNYHKAYYTNSEAAWDRVRDSCIYQNFLKLEQHLSLQNEKLFGVWGHIHTYQSKSENTEWFASSLVQKSKKKVFSYRIFYFNSKCMLPASWLPGFLKFHKPKNRLYYPMKLQNDDKFITGKKEKVKSLKKVTEKHTISIVSLIEKTSPFTENPYLLINSGDDWNTTQYFQSAIIVKNSPACKPLGKNQAN